MNRPFLSSDIAELEALFASHIRDAAVLRQLAAELTRRQSSRASRLLSKVALELSKYGPEEEPLSEPIGVQTKEEIPIGLEHTEREIRFAEERQAAGISRGSSVAAGKHPVLDARGAKPSGTTELEGNADIPPDDRKRPARLSLMRPPGTAGLPNSWVRQLSQDLKLNLSKDAGLPEKYCAALSALIAEIRKTGAGQKRYEIDIGNLSNGGSELTLYVCPFPDDGELFEEARIEVLIGGRRVEGSIASITGGRLVLALKENLGPTIKNVILLVDATALLEALRTKIEQISKKELSLNRRLADAVVRNAELPPDPVGKDIPRPVRDLNEAQISAYRQALTKSVSYIWGPPGCGKTWTLAEIARATLARGERLLVCSNTNRAVDQILYQICKNLGPDHEDMEAGHIVRLGQIADDKLANEYSQYVLVDGIADRLAAELKARQAELEHQIASLDAKTESGRETVARHCELDKLETALAAILADTNRLARDGNETKTKFEDVGRRILELEKELHERNSAFLKILRRSERAIQDHIAATTNYQTQLIEAFRATKVRYDETGRRFKAAQVERDLAANTLSGMDRKAAEKQIADADAARAPLVSELRNIATKIISIRSEVMKRAKVLGATCTKAYLVARELGQFDLVLVDEASMVLLPAIWFVAGLSQSRVAVCGDFRQIPPIVQTNQQAVFEILGPDVFEAVGLDDARATDSRMVMLDEQYRMDESICGLISAPMYDGRLRTAKNRTTRFSRKLPEPFDGPLTIVDTSDLWPFESVNAFFSRYNLMHSLLARNLAWYFGEVGYVQGGGDLGICSPYAAQAKLIRRLLDAETGNDRIQVGTVHRFQGDERNTIILEIPESHGGGRRLGQFVQGVPPSHVGARLMNVALSRAENHLLVLANLTYLDQNLPSESLLRDVLHRMQRFGKVVPGSEVLRLRPIQQDLRGLIGKVQLDLDAERFGIFNQHTFDPAVAQDIAEAKESVVILSGFITQARVGALGDLLRERIASGVKVRCVTRPPQRNGSMDPNLTRDALDALEGIGCAVDCRNDIHEKIVLIDKSIVWHGSLNMLSHTHRTDESMTRLVNSGYAETIAGLISKRQISAEKALSTIADAENPRCAHCGSRSVFATGPYGPYFYCERECGWTIDLRRSGRKAHSATPEIQGRERSGPPCPRCGGTTRVREGRNGRFYGCVRYPECNGTANIR